jgi:uncharacterized SAM-dependent methyltransferase
MNAALLDELSTKLLEGRKEIWLDQPSNLYLSEDQANVYLNLMDDPRYAEAFHDPVKMIISAARNMIVAGLKEPIDILDLGPGYPDKTFPILDLFKSGNLTGRYVPVDINRQFLNIAETAAIPFGVLTHPLHCLFETLPEILNSSDFTSAGSRLVLLGLTFMNYRPTTILPLLQKLTRPSDTVVVATELFNEQDKATLIERYRINAAKELNLSVIRALAIPSSTVDYMARWSRNRIEMGFKVNQAITLTNDLILQKGLRILTAISYRYTLDGFRNRLQRHFANVMLFTDPNSTVAIAKCSQTT